MLAKLVVVDRGDGDLMLGKCVRAQGCVRYMHVVDIRDS